MVTGIWPLAISFPSPAHGNYLPGSCALAVLEPSTWRASSGCTAGTKIQYAARCLRDLAVEFERTLELPLAHLPAGSESASKGPPGRAHRGNHVLSYTQLSGTCFTKVAPVVRCSLSMQRRDRAASPSKVDGVRLALQRNVALTIACRRLGGGVEIVDTRRAILAGISILEHLLAVDVG